MIVKKGTKLYSILHGTCPKCHKGAFFSSHNPYRLKNILKMHEYCPECGFKYLIETSFFYGAMYVSYAFQVAQAIVVFIIFFTLLKLSLKVSFIAIVIALIFLSPISLRLSRLIWANIFVSYNPGFKNEKGILIEKNRARKLRKK